MDGPPSMSGSSRRTDAKCTPGNPIWSPKSRGLDLYSRANVAKGTAWCQALRSKASATLQARPCLGCLSSALKSASLCSFRASRALGSRSLPVTSLGYPLAIRTIEKGTWTKASPVSWARQTPWSRVLCKSTHTAAHLHLACPRMQESAQMHASVPASVLVMRARWNATCPRFVKRGP